MGNGNFRSSLGNPERCAHHPAMSRKNPTVAPKPVPAPKPPTADTEPAKPKTGSKEIGGPVGLEPTRYGDWEIKGRCIDF
jgi:hypothetical protein